MIEEHVSRIGYFRLIGNRTIEKSVLPGFYARQHLRKGGI